MSFCLLGVGFALLLSSSLTTASSPLVAAYNSGVWLSLSFKLASTFSMASNSWTTLLCPFLIAYNSGVRLSSSFESASTFSMASSSWTTALCPFAAAYNSGVQLSFVTNRRLTASDCPEGNRRDYSMSGNQTSNEEGGVQCVMMVVCIYDVYMYT